MATETLVSKNAVSTSNFDLDTLTMSEFLDTEGYNKFNHVKGVQLNTNGYPFVTFLHESETFTNSEGKEVAKAQNIYFTKRCDELGLVDETTPENPLPKGFLSQFQAVYAPCAAADVYTGTGAKRKLAEKGYAWKFCPAGGGSSEYGDASDWL
jgi:hypothetical protein